MVRGESAKPKRPENRNKFYSTLLWKTQNQQNLNLNHGNLVASKRSSASRMPKEIFYEKKFCGIQSTIITGGDASVKPEHLSFLIIWRHRQHHQGQPKKQ